MITVQGTNSLNSMGYTLMTTLLVPGGTMLTSSWSCLLLHVSSLIEVKLKSVSLCTFSLLSFLYRFSYAHVIFLHGLKFNDFLISLMKSHSSRCSYVSSAPELQELYLHCILSLYIDDMLPFTWDVILYLNLNQTRASDRFILWR